LDIHKVFRRRRPTVPMALATAVAILVAYLGAVAGPATAKTPRYRGPAPGAVTCQMKGSMSFLPPVSTSGRGKHSARLVGTLSGCNTSSSAVTINEGRLEEKFSSSPLSCATVSSTGAAATSRLTWKGRFYATRATFSPTTQSNSRSQLVTNGSGFEGFSIPGANGRSAASGSFAAASGSTAAVYTSLSPTALASMCRKGVKKLAVTGTVTVGAASVQGGRGVGSRVPLGVYAGTDQFQNVADFGSSTGAHLTYVTDYLNKTDGWATMAGAAIATSWSGSGYRLVLGVPILPGTGTLAEGATGAYNQYFTTLAQNLVAGGEANAILRLGWEFNGSWYPWSVATTGDAANFARFWQQIVTTMRGVPGAQFKFAWNASGSTSSSYPPERAYPGDSYVDYVGTDVYDNFWGSPFTPSAGWANQLSEQWGLNWLAQFAAAHGKPIGIPEWSVEYRPDGHGLGDDPSFVDNMATWLASNNVAFANVFSFDTSRQYRNNILDGTFANSLAAFKADFG
jgi:hypothetical protein